MLLFCAYLLFKKFTRTLCRTCVQPCLAAGKFRKLHRIHIFFSHFHFPFLLALNLCCYHFGSCFFIFFLCCSLCSLFITMQCNAMWYQHDSTRAVRTGASHASICMHARLYVYVRGSCCACTSTASHKIFHIVITAWLLLLGVRGMLKK